MFTAAQMRLAAKGIDTAIESMSLRREIAYMLRYGADEVERAKALETVILRVIEHLSGRALDKPKGPAP